jgi:hypothetical protein
LDASLYFGGGLDGWILQPSFFISARSSAVVVFV